MESTSRSFARSAIGAWVAAALFPAGAVAADEVQTLRSEVDALRKEVRDIRAAAPQPASPWTGPLRGATQTLYGTLNADVGTVERSGATASAAALNSMVGAPGLAPTDHPRHGQLRSNSSNFGIRGERPLSGGLKAVFQLESAIGVDGNASTLAGRDTFLGLSAGWGSVLFGGNIDTPYKRGVQGKDPFFVTGVATQKGILGSPGFNVASVNAVAGTTVGGNAANAQQQNAGFDIRANNLLMYRSPVVRGFSGEIGYGLNEQKANSTAAAQIDPKLISFLGRYEMGKLWVTYAYEQHDDVFGLNSLLAFVPGTGVTGAQFNPPAGASSKDTGNKVGVAYLLGSTELLVVWERLKYATNTGAVTEYRRDAWVGSVNHRFGPNRAIVSYSIAGAGSCQLAAAGSCSTSGLGAKQIALGYVRDVDQATSLYAFYTRIANDEAAAYNFGVSGAPAAGVGADPEALALGVRYRF